MLETSVMTPMSSQQKGMQWYVCMCDVRTMHAYMFRYVYTHMFTYIGSSVNTLRLYSPVRQLEGPGTLHLSLLYLLAGLTGF